MKQAILLAAALIVIAAPSQGGAQTAVPPPPLQLTLEEAMAAGLRTSHRLAEFVARGDAAEAATAERHAATRPQIAAEAGYTRTNHVDIYGIPSNNRLTIIYPDVPDNYRTRLDLQWPIYTSGRYEALERAARADWQASSDDLAAARADLRLEITRAYWALVTAGESLRVVEESVTRIDAHLRDVRNQLTAGLVPPNDVLTVEAQESRQRMLAIQARTTREVAEAELVRLIGVLPGTPIEPTAALEDSRSVRAPQALASLIEQARQQRPERAALSKRMAAASERVTAAVAGLKPTVAVAGGFDYARPNPRIFPRQEAWKQSWDASVNLRWPLLDGGRTRAQTAEAAANSRAIEERLADFDAALAVELRQRASEDESGQAAIEAAGDAVRSATEARRVVGERFAAGVATSTDVLDAQVALLQAELDRTQAIANARIARARLERAVGE